MKTISIRLNIFYRLMIFLSMIVLTVSCGGYQNVSYFDRDGIYGDASQQNDVVTAPDNANNSNQYKNYFESLQDPASKKDSTFTDVERYSSDRYNDQESRNNNSIWGGDAGTTVVNIYDNNWGWNNWGWNNWGWGNYWNWNIGWGWDPWFGPNWGFGWGWNSWYGNPWWGGHYQPYHHGIRSFSGANRGYTNVGTRNFSGRRSSNTDFRDSRNSFDGRRGENVIRSSRTNNNFNSGRNPVRNNSNVNQPNTTPRSNSNSTQRFQNSSSRNNSTPRNNSYNNSGYNSGSRSSGGNYGGGRSSGGSYGGGRSFGGGRR